MTDATEAVLEEVAIERGRQIAKWGGRDGDGIENPATSNYVRLRVLAEEFGEVAEAMGRPEDGNGKRDLRTELIQVAAVAVAWLEGLS
jgi:NTP pyrophosphatase (non-canonical NTP hydrolase)